jgi:hypothetical protein
MTTTLKPSSAISRIFGLISQPVHPYRPSTEVFLELNVDRVADDLDLPFHGQERGKKNQPSEDAQTMDDIEHRVVEIVERHKQDANSIFLDHRHTYDDRLAALNFEERFSIIRQAAPEAVGDFRTEAALGRDELSGLRRRLYDCERERDNFRAAHGLQRPARLSTTGAKILKVGILAILFIIEVAVNSSFLAASNIGGILGGAGQAFTFAALNILASFFAGLVAIRLLVRRGFFAKLVGFISVLLYLAFAVVLNLTLAHLREIPPSITADVGQEVLKRLQTAPLIFSDVNSWVFFGIGFAFSLIAMTDGLLFTDPYFGYASVEKRCNDARQQYTNGKAQLIEQLRDIRDNATKVMNDAAHDLGVRRGEYDSIVQAKARLGQRFSEHQNHVERTARALLAIYREANRRHRTSPAPDYFTKPYAMERIIYVGNEQTETAREQLRKDIAKSQEILNSQVEAIYAAFEQAVQSYREIDDLIPEDKREPAKAA